MMDETDRDTGPCLACGGYDSEHDPGCAVAAEITPLEARDALVRLLRAKAPRADLEAAADAYREAIRALGRRTKRRLPVPSRAFIIRFLS